MGIGGGEGCTAGVVGVQQVVVVGGSIQKKKKCGTSGGEGERGGDGGGNGTWRGQYRSRLSEQGRVMARHSGAPQQHVGSCAGLSVGTVVACADHSVVGNRARAYCGA